MKGLLNLQNSIKESLRHSYEELSKLIENDEIITNLSELSEIALRTIKNNGKIIFCGNGGSAAESQHFAAELVSKFNHNRTAVNAISLTTDTSALTSIANDFGYENIFSRQLEAIAKKGDLLIAISTSGKSKNIINAINFAEKNSITASLWTGDHILDNSLNSKKIITIKSTSKITSIIQEQQLIFGHIFCAIIENHVLHKDYSKN